jgi:hypothetical protein
MPFLANIVNPSGVPQTIGKGVLTPFNNTQRAHLLAEWRADSNSGADSSLVTTWADQTANGYNLTVSTTGYKPIVWANAIGTNKGVAFDGIDDRLTAPIAFTGSACTILIAIADKGTHTGGVCGAINSGNGNDATSTTSLLPMFMNAGNFDSYRNNGHVTSSAISAATPYVLAFRIAANGNVAQCVNSSKLTGALTSGAFAWVNFVIGARFSTGPANFLDAIYLYGAIYDYDLSDSDLTAATSAIRTFYGF